MKIPVTAVYPGTFDPITCGHEDVIERARRLFDHVVVAVAIAHHKKTLFSLAERLAQVRQATAAWPNVRAEPFEGLITHFAVEHKAQVMVRGLRAANDFDYEAQLARMNATLAPRVETVFLAARADLQPISSTLVREITLLGGDASTFVSAPVWAELQSKRQS